MGDCGKGDIGDNGTEDIGDNEGGEGGTGDKVCCGGEGNTEARGIVESLMLESESDPALPLPPRMFLATLGLLLGWLRI